MIFVLLLFLVVMDARGDIRLVGGDAVSEGRVEIYYNGQWGTVCDDDWDMDDAAVVCRELGFPGAVKAPQQARFGEGSDPIWLDNVDCSGVEKHLVDCSSRGFGNHDCRHGEDASVICEPVLVGNIRLVGGNADTEGRVEIYYDDQWGTVCDDNWDMDNAAVVCRELGFPGAVEAPGAGRFGEGTDPIWLANVVCSGGEERLADCSHNGWGIHHCAHSEDASVVCDRDIRLVGGGAVSEGRVEIYYNGQWGTVCDGLWDMDNAAVVCRELGFPGAVEAPRRSRFGEGSGLFWLDYVTCIGDEEHLVDCSTLGIGGDCLPGSDASVICERAIRLVGGNADTEGRVEIYYDGQWGTVCDDNWDMDNAAVVCRELGFPGAVKAPIRARFGEGADRIWLDDVDCSGDEKRVAACSNRGWGIHNCAHSEDASVICESVVWGGWKERGGSSCYELTGDCYEEVRKVLSSHGVTIDTELATELTTEYLNTIDVFFAGDISDPEGVLSSDEQESLRFWVEEKGGILLIAGCQRDNYNSCTSFLEPFGLQRRENYRTAGGNDIWCSSGSHQIVEGVNKIYVVDAQVLSPIDSVDMRILCTFHDGSITDAVLDFGNGKIFFSNRIFYDFKIDTSDNAKYFDNLVEWTTGNPPTKRELDGDTNDIPKIVPAAPKKKNSPVPYVSVTYTGAFVGGSVLVTVAAILVFVKMRRNRKYDVVDTVID